MDGHFTRRAVFPGTLRMDANLQTAALLAAEVSSGKGTAWRPRTVSAVKIRSFVCPGETLRLEARRTGRSDGGLSVAVEARIQQRLIGSADIQFSAEAHS